MKENTTLFRIRNKEEYGFHVTNFKKKKFSYDQFFFKITSLKFNKFSFLKLMFSHFSLEFKKNTCDIGGSRMGSFGGRTPLPPPFSWTNDFFENF